MQIIGNFKTEDGYVNIHASGATKEDCKNELIFAYLTTFGKPYTNLLICEKNEQGTDQQDEPISGKVDDGSPLPTE